MTTQWINIGKTADFPSNMGGCVKRNGKQIAVFNLNDGAEWYAIQNLCPHDKRMVLARGLTGTLNGEPKVSCPLHKRNFSLKSGDFLGEGDCDNVQTFPIKVEGDDVFLELAD